LEGQWSAAGIGVEDGSAAHGNGLRLRLANALMAMRSVPGGA
jgi:hypothetical protein